MLWVLVTSVLRGLTSLVSGCVLLFKSGVSRRLLVGVNWVLVLVIRVSFAVGMLVDIGGLVSCMQRGLAYLLRNLLLDSIRCSFGILIMGSPYLVYVSFKVFK